MLWVWGICHFSVPSCDLFTPLYWRYNERNGVSNHWRLDGLFNRLFRHRSKKYLNSASLAFVRGIHRWSVDSPHKGPVTREMFPLDGVIMLYSIASFGANHINTRQCVRHVLILEIFFTKNMNCHIDFKLNMSLYLAIILSFVIWLKLNLRETKRGLNLNMLYDGWWWLDDTLGHGSSWRRIGLVFSSQWRHDKHDGVSNHQHFDCLLNRLFRRSSKETP